MTPLHLRRRLRSLVTILAAPPPEPARQPGPPPADEWSRLQRERDALADAQRRLTERERASLAMAQAPIPAVKSAAKDALDAISAACGCEEWDYPGQVVRDVRAVVRERNEAVALISTVRAQNAGYAAELAEVDQVLGRALGYPTMGPEVGGDHTTVCTGEHTVVTLAMEAAGRLSKTETLANRFAREAGDAERERDALRRQVGELTRPLPADIEAALREVQREWPCAHESWEECSGEWRKCADCGVTFSNDGATRAGLASKKFGHAIDTLRRALRSEPTPTPKRKPTAGERWEKQKQTIAAAWGRGMGHAVQDALTKLGPSTSRAIATHIWSTLCEGGKSTEDEVRNDMRWVQDFARAGYLTVAKGPKGVPVYSLKEEG